MSSIWEGTKTFFPLFLDRLDRHFGAPGRACIVGAADGKFVLPLLRQGWEVVAIEDDLTALHGGMAELPGGKSSRIPGLLGRLRDEGILSGVEIVEADFLTCELPLSCDAAFTSCSWHYSKNHRVPVSVFIRKMQAIVRARGIFCAEYMMPQEERHHNVEHYLAEGALREFFGNEWSVVDEFYTEPFLEKAHIGNLNDHSHRMGFLLAVRLS